MSVWGLSYEKMKKWSDAESAFEKAVQYAENIRKTLDQVTKRTFLHGGGDSWRETCASL